MRKLVKVWKATRSHCAMAAIAVSMLGLSSMPAQSGTILSISPASINGAVGTGLPGNEFEVLLTNTGPSAVTIGSFGFSVTTDSSATNLTDALITTADPYIFAGSSLFAVGNSIATSTGTTLKASDATSLVGGVTLGAGMSDALGLATFDVAPSIVPGTYDVTILPYPETSLADANGNNVTIDTITNGTITINAATIPEPTTLAMGVEALIAAAGFAVWRARSRNRARP